MEIIFNLPFVVVFCSVALAIYYHIKNRCGKYSTLLDSPLNVAKKKKPTKTHIKEHMSSFLVFYLENVGEKNNGSEWKQLKVSNFYI